MIGEIICVGNELLMGDTLNTNTKYLSQQLLLLGIDVRFQLVVGDDEADLLTAIKISSQRSDVVIFTGGLGPTYDDMTKETLALALNRALIQDEISMNQISQYFKKRGRDMADSNKKQAYKLEGSQVLSNANGTAPGLYIEVDHTHYILLPGPPLEMKAMFLEQVKSILEKFSKEVITTRTLQLIGIGESDLEAKISHIMDGSTNPRIAPYASLGMVKLKLIGRTQTASEGEALIKKTMRQLLPYIQQYIYTQEDQSLEAVILERMQEKEETLTVAESCTGGGLSNRLIAISGASIVYQSGFVTYSNRAKTQQLNVSAQLIKSHGAVSGEVATAMAEGAREVSGANVGVGITGIAGPEGGTKEKPVGTVYIAVADQEGVQVERYQFIGNRTKIQALAVQYGLIGLWHRL